MHVVRTQDLEATGCCLENELTHWDDAPEHAQRLRTDLVPSNLGLHRKRSRLKAGLSDLEGLRSAGFVERKNDMVVILVEAAVDPNVSLLADGEVELLLVGHLPATAVDAVASGANEAEDADDEGEDGTDERSFHGVVEGYRQHTHAKLNRDVDPLQFCTLSR